VEFERCKCPGRRKVSRTPSRTAIWRREGSEARKLRSANCEESHPRTKEINRMGILGEQILV